MMYHQTGKAGRGEPKGDSMLHFTKMQGIGNDYIYFDCFRETVSDPSALAVRLSDRHFGVGGDGIVLICPSGVADAKMRMFNADGSEGRMCGNAIRCVGKYLYERRGIRKKVLTVETLSGIRTLYLHFADTADVGSKPDTGCAEPKTAVPEEAPHQSPDSPDAAMENGQAKTVASVTVDMGKAVLEPEKIPCLAGGDSAIGKVVLMAGGEYRINAVSMGNPHCVLFTHENFPDDFSLDAFDIASLGSRFEHDPLFPERVNTEFARLGDDGIHMRVWERGSGETLACGTGACATAVAAVENGFYRMGEEIPVHLRGGVLTVSYTEDRVLMTGPAAFVFDGECGE